METLVRLVNGVDVRRLKETVMAVKAQPSLGKFNFRAQNEWVKGGHNISTIKDFYGAGKEDTSRANAFVLHNDEPDVLLGNDNGANPVEYILHALAGCLTTSMVYHAAARGYKIDRVQTSYEGKIDLNGFLGIDPGTRNGFQLINVTVQIDGDLTVEQKKEIIALGPAYSPVFDTITGKVPVEIKMAES